MMTNGMLEWWVALHALCSMLLTMSAALHTKPRKLVQDR